MIDNRNFYSNKIIVCPKSKNDVQLQVKFGSKNPTGLPVGVVRIENIMITKKTRGIMNMSGKTHLVVGTATTLLVMQPETIGEVATCLGAGVVGALISDIDVVSSKAHRLVNKIAAVVAIISAIVVLLDCCFDIALFEDNKTLKVIIGAIAFVGICVYGKDQPHRAFMHSFTALAMLSLALYFIYAPVVPYFAVAMTSHMLIDLLNYVNVRLFYPLKWGKSFDICYANGEGNKSIWAICSIITIIEVVYFTGRILLKMMGIL